MIRKKNKKQADKKNTEKSEEEDDLEDYQLSRAFDLILALNLINNKTTQ